jgi:hypothetical protein
VATTRRARSHASLRWYDPGQVQGLADEPLSLLRDTPSGLLFVEQHTAIASDARVDTQQAVLSAACRPEAPGAPIRSRPCQGVTCLRRASGRSAPGASRLYSLRDCALPTGNGKRLSRYHAVDQRMERVTPRGSALRSHGPVVLKAYRCSLPDKAGGVAARLQDGDEGWWSPVGNTTSDRLLAAVTGRGGVPGPSSSGWSWRPSPRCQPGRVTPDEGRTM